MSKYESEKKSWPKSHSFTSAPNQCIATQEKKQLIFGKFEIFRGIHMQEEVQALRAERSLSGGVDTPLPLVRQLTSAPLHLQDPTMISSPLRTLADRARSTAH